MKIINAKKLIIQLDKKEAIMIRNVMESPNYKEETESENGIRFNIWHAMRELIK